MCEAARTWRSWEFIKGTSSKGQGAVDFFCSISSVVESQFSQWKFAMLKVIVARSGNMDHISWAEVWVQSGICRGFSYGSFTTSTLCSTFHQFFSKRIEVDLVLLPDFRLFPGATHNLQDLDSLICGRPAVVWQQDDSTLVCRGCLPSAAQSASLHVDCCWDVA